MLGFIIEPAPQEPQRNRSPVLNKNRRFFCAQVHARTNGSQAEPVLMRTNGSQTEPVLMRTNGSWENQVLVLPEPPVLMRTGRFKNRNRTRTTTLIKFNDYFAFVKLFFAVLPLFTFLIVQKF